MIRTRLPCVRSLRSLRLPALWVALCAQWALGSVPSQAQEQCSIDDLVLSSALVVDEETHLACKSIFVEETTVLDGGALVLLAPKVVLGDSVLIEPGGELVISPPSCNALPLTEEEIEAAVLKYMGQVDEPWDSGWTEVLRLAMRELGCVGADVGPSADQMSPDRMPPSMCDSIFCPDVQYCGPGTSETFILLKFLIPSETLNRLCFEHDTCYRRQCVASACNFSVNPKTAACDQPMFEACETACDGACTKNVDTFICAVLEVLPSPIWNTPRRALCETEEFCSGEMCLSVQGECGTTDRAILCPFDACRIPDPCNTLTYDGAIWDTFCPGGRQLGQTCGLAEQWDHLPACY